MGLESYICPKCGHPAHEVGEIRAAGGIWSKIFDVSTEKFTTVTCARCRYTEFFAVESSRLGDVVDLFTS